MEKVTYGFVAGLLVSSAIYVAVKVSYLAGYEEGKKKEDSKNG